MTKITSRDNVTLVEIQNLDSAGSLMGTDEFIVSQSGGVVRKTTFDDIFALAASASDIADLESTFLTALSGYVTLTTTQTISGTKTFSGEVNVAEAVNSNNPVRKSAFDSHTNNTSNPHSVTPAQVGNTTAQWNASKIQGVDVSTTTPSDGEGLIYDDLTGEYVPTLISGLTSGNQTFSGEKTFTDTAFFDDVNAITLDGNLNFTKSSNQRWQLTVNSETESGSDAGSNFELGSFDDSGTYKDLIFKVDRASGKVAFTETPTAPTASINTDTTQIATTAYVMDAKPRITILWDRKTAGTDGGTPTTGSWGTRDLNYEQLDEVGVTISSNQFTLPGATLPGRYLIESLSPFFRVRHCQTRIYNVTGAAVVTDSYSPQHYAADQDSAGQSLSDLVFTQSTAMVTISANTTYRIEYRVALASSLLGLGYAVNTIWTVPYEYYTRVKVTYLGSAT